MRYDRPEIHSCGIIRKLIKLIKQKPFSTGFDQQFYPSPAQLQQISKSDYYCVTSKKDKGLKNDEVMNRIIDIYYFHKGRLKGLIPFDYRNQALMSS